MGFLWQRVALREEEKGMTGTQKGLGTTRVPSSFLLSADAHRETNGKWRRNRKETRSQPWGSTKQGRAKGGHVSLVSRRHIPGHEMTAGEEKGRQQASWPHRVRRELPTQHTHTKKKAS